MHGVEGGTLGLAEGLGASLATVASLTLAMKHDVPFAFASVGATALIVTKIARADLRGFSPCRLRTTDKDAAEAAFCTTQRSSTVAWVLRKRFPAKTSLLRHSSARTCPVLKAYFRRICWLSRQESALLHLTYGILCGDARDTRVYTYVSVQGGELGPEPVIAAGGIESIEPRQGWEARS
jgi:hypothetical protein